MSGGSPLELGEAGGRREKTNETGQARRGHFTIDLKRIAALPQPKITRKRTTNG